MSTKWDNNEAVQRLRNYLRIPTVHPDVDYSDCVEFLKKEAKLLGLKVAQHELVPKKPVLVVTLEGLQGELPSILLNSHMDVGPVNEEKWTYPPFDAVISEDGFIYARGTQDMKGIGMMQFEAVKKLKEAGVDLKRTVHMIFVPDEEIGGVDGMGVFAESEEFKKLNVGFGLGKGAPSESQNKIEANNGERTEKWTYPPFDAVISEDGFIYARGTQDMKGIGMMQFEAVKKLKEAGVDLKRTVHMIFVPDEEIGGVDGMGVFAESEEFKKLNVGFGLGKGAPSESQNKIEANNGERTVRQITITCRGEPGHGSIMPANTAGEKLHYILKKFMTFRAQEKIKLNPNCELSGDVTSINLTKISGGLQINVLPTELTASFDIRVAPSADMDEFESMVSKWCSEAGEGVTFEYRDTAPQTKSLVLEGNAFWSAMSKAAHDLGIELDCKTFGGSTDSRYLRRQGIPMINFAPIMNTKLLVHDHNETIHVDVFLRGIEVMTEVVKALGNV